MGEIVISARIALQLTRLQFDHDFQHKLAPSDCAALAARLICFEAYPMIKLALHSLAVYLDLGYTSSQWLATVAEADRFGHSFRRCFHWDYKENRRLTPRITNRGGQLPLEPAGLVIETGETDDGQSGTTRDKGDSGDRLAERDTATRRIRLSRLGS